VGARRGRARDPADRLRPAGLRRLDADGLNYFNGMGRVNIVEFGAAMQGREPIAALARDEAEQLAGATPEDIVEAMRTLVTPVDDAVLSGEFGEFYAASMVQVFAQGTDGWVDDDLAFTEPFGFGIADVAAPALVWHGRHDRLVPVSHGEWLARAIPGAEARISIDDGHITLVANRVPQVHSWLLARF
jgi:pimeloyl-ACP methyl ester carboxylesterase